MASVFISYRRTDSLDATKRIAARLQRLLGKRNVFIDIDSIASGESFPQRLQLALDRADAVLVVIGPTWATAANGYGLARLADPTDFVRIEVQTALASGKPVIPLYIDGATLTQDEAPPELAPLLQRPSLAIATKALDDPNGLQALRAVQSQAIQSSSSRSPRISYPALLVMALLAGLGGIGSLIESYLTILQAFDSAFSFLLGILLTPSVILAIVRMIQDRLWGWLGFTLALIIVPFFADDTAHHALQPYKPVWAGAIIVALLGLSIFGKRIDDALTLWRNARAARKG